MPFSSAETTTAPSVQNFARTATRARLARQLVGLPWIVFLVWTGVGFIVLPFDLSEARVRAWLLPEHPQLTAAIAALLRVSDATWMSLAALNVYFATVASEGLRIARRWAGAILLGSAVFEWIGATTGLPFGPYVYTERFGLRLGDVLPFTIPLAWLVILLGARATVLCWRPAITRTELAIGVALLAVLTDVNLEFIAWNVRGYWLWYPHWSSTHPALPLPS
ncbi:MAG: carotenoid biosynthesis protein, partial [Verrucomicrobia bacterium]|nr:carotenoid biosynthesis protein [Verrucomicrobiota bacterium]